MKIKLSILIIGFAVIGALFLNGCNTTKGFGEDLEQSGQAIQNAAT
jgi:predicted small secreted protein